MWNTQELESDPEVAFQKPTHGDLSAWAKQVLFFFFITLKPRVE